MAKFSERYGYTRLSDVIIRENITEEIQNAICSCYDRLRDGLCSSIIGFNQTSLYNKLEKYL